MSSDRLTHVLLGTIALILVGSMLQATQNVVIPIILAVGLAVIVQPLVERLRRHMPLGLALGVTILLMGGFIVGAGSLFALSISGITAKVPEYTLRFQNMFQGVLDLAGGYGVEVSWDQVGTEESVGWALSLFSSAFGSVLNIVGQVFLILLMMVFLVLEASVFRQKIDVAFADSTRFRISRSLHAIASKLQQYVVTKTLISLLTGFCTAFVTWIVGVDFPIFWGGIAFMLNYIPNVGSIIAVIPPVLIALLQFDSLVEPIVVLALLTTVQMTIGNILEPRMLGRSLQLSAFVVLLSMIAWGWLWGIVGVVISVPLTVAIKITCENIEALRPIAVLLSDIAELEPLRKEPASPLEPLPSGEVPAPATQPLPPVEDVVDEVEAEEEEPSAE